MTLRFFAVLLAIVVLASSTGNSRAQTVGTAVLTWTAPGDDGNLGNASLYDVRFSLEPINDENFVFANRITMLRPKRPGSNETYTVQGLLPGYDYYFAVRTVDDAGNWSRVSNLAFRPSRNIRMESVTLPFNLSMPSPNPARNSTRVMLTMPRSGEVLVEVYDSQGRYVHTLVNGHHPAGPAAADWRLDTYRGQPVAAGVYLIRAKFGDTQILRRVAVVR